MKPLLFSEITKYKGLLDKCTVEGTLDGLALFDKKNVFVGVVTSEGFSLNMEYKYAGKIKAQLEKAGVTVFPDQARERSKWDEFVDIIESLYGEP